MIWTEPECEAIAALLTREFGVAFPPARRVFAETAMRRAMTVARARDAATYLERLEREPPLLRALIAEVTIGETYFFRDPDQFEVIRTAVIPDALARHAGAAPLRIWSAGCSSGEEAYSLAMLLAECGLGDRTQLLATDVSANAIERARRGQYGAWSFRRDVAGWRERCFVRTGKRWSVGAPFRRIAFAVHNVMQALPVGLAAAGGFDLIVCRNVLLYFDRETIARASRVLLDALAPGGWLVMSPTDPPLPEDLPLEAVLTPAGVVYRRTAVAPQRPAFVLPRVVEPAPRSLVIAAAPRHARGDGERPAAVQRPADDLDAEVFVERALALLDAREPAQAAASARRALYIDRSLAIAHLTLARALRLTGSVTAAQRALRRGAALLEAQAPDDVVRCAHGVTAGTLSAVAAAEFELLAGRPA